MNAKTRLGRRRGHCLFSAPGLGMVCGEVAAAIGVTGMSCGWVVDMAMKVILKYCCGRRLLVLLHLCL